MSTLTFNPSLNSLPTYQPGRPIEEVARELGLPADHVIKLASNENPFGPSPLARAAMEKALGQLNLYPDGSAFYLKNRLAEHLGVMPSNLVLGNGSNEIIEFVGQALLAPGTSVVVSEYCFAIYPIVTRMFGAELISVPARNFGHDIPAMLRAVRPDTRVMFVANPNNPTGTLVSRADVAELINNIPDYVLLVMDEAYIEFLDEAIDLLPFVRNSVKPNLILMRTFSKIYGLAGLRVGYGVAARDLAAVLEKVRQPFNLNSMAQAAAIAALQDTEHVERTRANNFAGIRWFEAAFRELNLPFVPSVANFVLVKVGNGADVFRRLQERGVIVRPMDGYNLPEYVRISVGTPAENARCIDALKSLLGR